MGTIDDVYRKMGEMNPEVKEIYENKIDSKKRTLRENIEFYRKRLQEARSDKEAVMKRFFGMSANRCRPMMVEKITLNRIIDKHGNNGLINISAWLSSEDQETNEKNTQELIKDLRMSGYRFLPGYGGYRDIVKGEESDFEPSFNVFNYNRKGEPQNFEKLKQFGISLAKKYNQSSVLVKAPTEPPVWIDGDGNKMSKDETNIVYKNDAHKPYFTSLKSLEDIENTLKQYYVRYCKDHGIATDYKNGGYEKWKEKYAKDVPVSRRYSYDMKSIYDECYVNPSPCTLIERQWRTETGEILVDLEIV